MGLLFGFQRPNGAAAAVCLLLTPLQRGVEASNRRPLRCQVRRPQLPLELLLGPPGGLASTAAVPGLFPATWIRQRSAFTFSRPPRSTTEAGTSILFSFFSVGRRRCGFPSKGRGFYLHRRVRVNPVLFVPLLPGATIGFVLNRWGGATYSLVFPWACRTAASLPVGRGF